MTVRLDTPRPLVEIARIAGVSYWSIRRHLLALDKELHGTLLTKRWGPKHHQPRYYCNLASLRKVWPDFGKKFATAEDLDQLREEVSEVQRNTVLLAKEIGQVWGRVKALEK